MCGAMGTDVTLLRRQPYKEQMRSGTAEETRPVTGSVSCKMQEVGGGISANPWGTKNQVPRMRTIADEAGLSGAELDESQEPGQQGLPARNRGCRNGGVSKSASSQGYEAARAADRLGRRQNWSDADARTGRGDRRSVGKARFGCWADECLVGGRAADKEKLRRGIARGESAEQSTSQV